ncbi:MAG: hypothetical protein Q9209_002115 [Squamulea sp. 1 TL-2023]
MARPQQSPRMRDHWRDEGNREEDTSRSGRPRERSNGRRTSPAASRRRERERSIDAEVKIRGRASVEEAHRLPSTKHSTGRDRHFDPHFRRGLSPSPQRRKQREGLHHQSEDLSEDKFHQRRRDIVNLNLQDHRLPLVPTTTNLYVRTTYLQRETPTSLPLGIEGPDHRLSRSIEISLPPAKGDLLDLGIIIRETHARHTLKTTFSTAIGQEEQELLLLLLIDREHPLQADIPRFLIQEALRNDRVDDPTDPQRNQDFLSHLQQANKPEVEGGCSRHIVSKSSIPPHVHSLNIVRFQISNRVQAPLVPIPCIVRIVRAQYK